MSSDWILDLIERGGYLAVAFLMLAENVFPPIPSEVVMPVAGIAAERGEMSIALVIVFGTIGAVVGQLIWFYLGLWIGEDRLKTLARHHGRWITVAPRDIDRADDWFDRHGHKAVFFGRMVPGIRTLISLPAGLSEMRLATFLLYSTLGSGIWTGLLAWAGYALGEQSEDVTRYISPIANIVVISILGYYIYRVATFKTS